MLPKVLILEDDRQLNRLLRKGFETVNLAVIQTYSLAEAYSALERENIAIIVTDLGLPDGDGTELIDHVKTRYNGKCPKIIVMTGRDINQNTYKGYDILQKPVNVTELIRLAIQVRYGRKI
jgi:DNA-binding response OmpR family regulator